MLENVEGLSKIAKLCYENPVNYDALENVLIYMFRREKRAVLNLDNIRDYQSDAAKEDECATKLKPILNFDDDDNDDGHFTKVSSNKLDIIHEQKLEESSEDEVSNNEDEPRSVETTPAAKTRGRQTRENIGGSAATPAANTRTCKKKVTQNSGKRPNQTPPQAHENP